MPECTGCGRTFEKEETILYGFDEPYCGLCFDNTFYYCERCDRLIYQNQSYSDSSGYPLCEDCHDSDDEDSQDDNCPHNPNVSDLDREIIINLSNNWLNGSINTMTSIKIKKGDFKLEEIREKVGKVNNRIYLYGLQDREEYQLKASSDIVWWVREYLQDMGRYHSHVEEDSGTGRLGISRKMREEEFDFVVEMIQALCSEGRLKICAA